MTVEYFEIIPTSEAQMADAGWYFQILIDGTLVGDPVGPFETKGDAASGAEAER